MSDQPQTEATTAQAEATSSDAVAGELIGGNDHYVTALTMVGKRLVIACRCGELITHDLDLEATAQWRSHRDQADDQGS